MLILDFEPEMLSYPVMSINKYILNFLCQAKNIILIAFLGQILLPDVRLLKCVA